jgi:hypothetical protein
MTLNSNLLVELGRVVANAGALEHMVSGCILCIAQYLGKEAGRVAVSLLVPGLSMSQKIDMLQRLALCFCEDAEKPNWESLVQDLRDLAQQRNRLLHDFVGLDEKEVTLARSKKGRGFRNDWSESKIAIEELISFNQRVAARRRQIGDFFDDYLGFGKDLPHMPPSQDLFPLLRMTCILEHKERPSSNL